MATFEPVGELRYHRIAHNLFVAERYIDVDAQSYLGATGTVSSQIAQNDVMQAIPVKIGDVVLQCWVEILTSCTGGAAMDVGVGENADAFVDNTPLDGQLVDTNQTAATDCPHRFSAADWIEAKVLDAAVSAGKFKVCALIFRR